MLSPDGRIPVDTARRRPVLPPDPAVEEGGATVQPVTGGGGVGVRNNIDVPCLYNYIRPIGNTTAFYTCIAYLLSCNDKTNALTTNNFYLNSE